MGTLINLTYFLLQKFYAGEKYIFLMQIFMQK
jgi:hypothetical protein